MKIIKVLLPLLISITPIVSFCQVSGRVSYISILENEDFLELESNLYFNESESIFFVDMNSVGEKEDASENIKLTDDSSLEYQFDFTHKSPIKYQVYINRVNNSIISQNSVFKNWKTKPCVVFENSGLIKWDILPDVKKIGTFKVQKAATSFRGRKYEVWFAPEIPIPIGPWKFNGLPGLILEAIDEESGVQFLFSSIEIPYEIEGKITPPNEGEKMSIEEFAAYQNNFTEEFVRTLKAKLPRSVNEPEISVKTLVKSIEREF